MASAPLAGSACSHSAGPISSPHPGQIRLVVSLGRGRVALWWAYADSSESFRQTLGVEARR